MTITGIFPAGDNDRLPSVTTESIFSKDSLPGFNT